MAQKPKGNRTSANSKVVKRARRLELKKKSATSKSKA